jgi:hypothetical protein
VKKTLLIAPFDGPLAAALAAEASASGWTVALALARGGSMPAPGPAPTAADKADAAEGEIDATAEFQASTTCIAYDPRSFVSASSLVLSAINALGDLDAAVLVFDPAVAKAEFLSAKPGELSALVEERCAGPLFLARELVRRFEARKSGALLLFAPESPRDAALGPTASMADGAFEGLGAGLFAAAQASSWRAFGIRDASGQTDRAARYAIELLDDPKGAKAGRWLRFTGRSGIFG